MSTSVADMGPFGAVDVRSASTRADFDAASGLYTRTFGYGSAMSLNPLLLSAIVANGGSAVGAFDGERMVGFVYSFAGFDGGAPYVYSQAAFVEPGRQGQGIGRRLKQKQREIALAAGLRTMRWAFEPLKVRNAHFNLDVLGAEVRRLVPRYYGTPDSHRMIAEWDLATEPRPMRTSPPAEVRTHGRPVEQGDAIWLGVPVAKPGSALGEEIVGVLREFLDRGWVARSCVDAGGGTFAYRLCRDA